MTDVQELRDRIAAFRRWRGRGRSRRIFDSGVMELQRWRRELVEGPPDRLAAFVALELERAAVEYLRCDYNASRCRVRRIENALNRWEKDGCCPWSQPSPYVYRDRMARWAPVFARIEELERQKQAGVRS